MAGVVVVVVMVVVGGGGDGDCGGGGGGGRGVIREIPLEDSLGWTPLGGSLGGFPLCDSLGESPERDLPWNMLWGIHGRDPLVGTSGGIPYSPLRGGSAGGILWPDHPGGPLGVPQERRTQDAVASG